MTKLTHLHKYTRKTIGNKGYKVFKCTIPGCTHYVALNMALDRVCICNRCGKAMTITKANIVLSKPHCQECVVSISKSDESKIADKLKELGI